MLEVRGELLLDTLRLVLLNVEEWKHLTKLTQVIDTRYDGNNDAIGNEDTRKLCDIAWREDVEQQVY